MALVTAPVQVDGLPPGPLLAARLVVLFPFWPGLVGLARPNPGVNAFAWLDWTRDLPAFLWLVCAAAYLACAVALWLGWSARAAAALAGAVLLLDPLLNLAEYSNNRILAGLVLVLLGLHEPRTGLWPLRIQLSLMYGAAALNKVLDPDWRDGTFIEHWTGEVLDLRVYGAVRDAWSGADRVLGWSALLVESALAVLFLVESRTRAAIVAALSFHVGMLVLTEGTISWLFAYVVGATLVAFTRPSSAWPYLGGLMALRLLDLAIN